jgi:hypothetical protein
MKYGELIQACINIKKSWNDVTMTVDAHAEEFLKKVYYFISRLFSGQ